MTLDRNRRVSMAPIDLNDKDPGYITVDQEPVSQLSSVLRFRTSEVEDHWTFYSGENVRVKDTGTRCDCTERHDIGYHLTLVALDIPDVVSMRIPLIRKEGNDYVTNSESVAGARLHPALRPLSPK